jgi:hypothetical protein
MAIAIIAKIKKAGNEKHHRKSGVPIIKPVSIAASRRREAAGVYRWVWQVGHHHFRHGFVIPSSNNFPE